MIACQFDVLKCNVVAYVTPAASNDHCSLLHNALQRAVAVVQHRSLLHMRHGLVPHCQRIHRPAAAASRLYCSARHGASQKFSRNSKELLFLNLIFCLVSLFVSSPPMTPNFPLQSLTHAPQVPGHVLLPNSEQSKFRAIIDTNVAVFNLDYPPLFPERLRELPEVQQHLSNIQNLLAADGHAFLLCRSAGVLSVVLSNLQSLMLHVVSQLRCAGGDAPQSSQEVRLAFWRRVAIWARMRVTVRCRCGSWPENYERCDRGCCSSAIYTFSLAGDILLHNMWRTLHSRTHRRRPRTIT